MLSRAEITLDPPPGVHLPRPDELGPDPEPVHVRLAAPSPEALVLTLGIDTPEQPQSAAA